MLVTSQAQAHSLGGVPCNAEFYFFPQVKGSLGLQRPMRLRDLGASLAAVVSTQSPWRLWVLNILSCKTGERNTSILQVQGLLHTSGYERQRLLVIILSQIRSLASKRFIPSHTAGPHSWWWAASRMLDAQSRTLCKWLLHLQSTVVTEVLLPSSPLVVTEWDTGPCMEGQRGWLTTSCHPIEQRKLLLSCKDAPSASPDLVPQRGRGNGREL